MLEVIEKDVTEIAGQKLVPMKETEVGRCLPSAMSFD